MIELETEHELPEQDAEQQKQPESADSVEPENDASGTEFDASAHIRSHMAMDIDDDVRSEIAGDTDEDIRSEMAGDTVDDVRSEMAGDTIDDVRDEMIDLDDALPDEETDITPDEMAASEEFDHTYQAIIESLVFASDEPLTFRQIKDVIIGPDQALSAGNEMDSEPGSEDGAETIEESAPVARGRKRKEAQPFTINLVRRCVDSLNTDYRQTGRSFRITEIAGGFAFQTTHEFGNYVGQLFAERAKRRLSQSALESLAIIAFKQPISKPSIEAIRGVNADFVLKSLLERNLIAIVGRDSSVGRPLLYGTTKTFLKHFGLKNIDDLPKPREIQELLAEEREMETLRIDDIEERKTAELHHTEEDGHLFDTIPVDITDPIEGDGNGKTAAFPAVEDESGTAKIQEREIGEESMMQTDDQHSEEFVSHDNDVSIEASTAIALDAEAQAGREPDEENPEIEGTEHAFTDDIPDGILASYEEPEGDRFADEDVDNDTGGGHVDEPMLDTLSKMDEGRDDGQVSDVDAEELT